MAAGFAAALGQAPWGLWWLAMPAFAVGLWAIVQSGRPARVAWLFGVAHFGTALNWIAEPFHVDPEATAWMVPFALVIYVGGFALLWGAGGWIAHRLAPGCSLALALTLAFIESLRGWILTGFPWAQPAHIWIDSPILPLAGWVGPFGLMLLALVPGAVRPLWTVPVALGAAVVLGGMVAPAPLPPPDAPVVRVIQPNAPQHLKWRPDMIEVFFDRGLRATRAPFRARASDMPGPRAPDVGAPDVGAPDLIVWPETALPEILNRSAWSRAALARAARGRPVLIGARRVDADGRFRNSAALLSGHDGHVGATYDKHHLVPFGEYLPVEGLWERIGLGDLARFSAGGLAAGPGPGIIDVPRIGPVFPMICYEMIFARYVRQVERPRVMAQLTNDAWFGTSAAPYQHLALARLRAAEQGVPVVRAANTGISAIIDARGRIVAHLGLGRTGHVDAPLPVALAPGVYARVGDGPLYIAALMALALAIGARRRRARGFDVETTRPLL